MHGLISHAYDVSMETNQTSSTLDIKIAKARKAYFAAAKREATITTLTVPSKQRALEASTRKASAKLNALLAEKKASN